MAKLSIRIPDQMKEYKTEARNRGRVYSVDRQSLYENRVGA